MTNEEKDRFLSGLETALNNISHSRYFETERGYQGALIAELQQQLPNFNWNGAIVEQEYQKRIREHGLTVRPDLIIHVPFLNNEHNSRSEGNFVVFELKLNASENAAITDYENLSRMCSILNYPLAVFINIDSDVTHIEKYHGDNRTKLVSYSMHLSNGNPIVTKVEPNE